ncbi:bifunctional folylpolyglutamate synthase/dihydrofolate synthase [Crocinitomicaceae bacterium CZZ-1]|uniref:Dihydrofolate synthase/folylpolyglutamate synthase n=1 Tax=Taishania pollutisoli TaxID=2766479 RepID=A0A8J6TXG1_9FLAO|nr:folylpolyglutamate synthase/dihydrofolate synthase family protein [Taishania pollutisoli]MBC9812476.1 bifunctional folylpolyglutamate synthase/dihydrofolate synthase [Taishania pollutisoli]
MTVTTYREATDWLFQQFPSYQHIGGKAYKPGLEHINRLLAYFGNPQHDLRFIHVAGTNGKGSTCSMLASILTEAGNTVGLFTSPHIQDFRERIRVNGIMVSEAFVMECTQQIQQAELGFEPSFFEISFLMALLYFKASECNVCVIETGLGGRLDATNCITPLISLITNISIEHTQFLGNTIPEIAGEKAGIIKNDIPVVIGEREQESSVVFDRTAHEKNAPLTYASDAKITFPSEFPLLGTYQQANYKLVVTALKVLRTDFPVSNGHISAGLTNLAQNTGFYGRMQVVGAHPTVIFDVSHNEAGIKATLDYFSDKQNLFIVYGTSADKNLDAIFPLFPRESHYFFTEFTNERSATIGKLREFSSKYGIDGTFFQSAATALEAAKSTANKTDTILVFGSFFLISDFFEKK